MVEPISKCQKCAAPLTCKADASCWCAEFPPVVDIVEGQPCFCTNCLKAQVINKVNEMVEADQRKEIAALGIPKKLIQDIDYYINDQGKVVFSKWYHLRRGNCCGSGCVNCPYGHANVVKLF